MDRWCKRGIRLHAKELRNFCSCRLFSTSQSVRLHLKVPAWSWWWEIAARVNANPAMHWWARYSPVWRAYIRHCDHGSWQVSLRPGRCWSRKRTSHFQHQRPARHRDRPRFFDSASRRQVERLVDAWIAERRRFGSWRSRERRSAVFCDWASQARYSFLQVGTRGLDLAISVGT